MTGFFSLWNWILTVQDFILSFVSGQTVWERILANRKASYSKRLVEISQRFPVGSSKRFEIELERVRLSRTKSLIDNRVYAAFHKLENYRNLLKQINEIRSTKVTNTSETDLILFENIWKRLVLQSDTDEENLQMSSRRWMKIGFQNSNPLTDFRGMGLLGLQAIEHLSKDVERCLEYVNIPSPYDYSFAIGVINGVSWLVNLLELESKNGEISHPLLSHFAVYPCNIEEFFRLFSIVFNEWHEFWIDRNANIMQFEQLSLIFRRQLLNECQENRTIRSGFRNRIVN